MRAASHLNSGLRLIIARLCSMKLARPRLRVNTQPVEGVRFQSGTFRGDYFPPGLPASEADGHGCTRSIWASEEQTF